MKHLIALVAVTLATLSAPKVFAADPAPACTPKAEDVTSVLLNNAYILDQLKKDNYARNTDVTCEVKEPGVTIYKFKFTVCGMCFPQKHAELTIVEDRRPTYADGPTLYSTSLIETGLQ